MAEPNIHTDVNDRGELGRVVRITVDNTAKFNILNAPLIEKLRAAIEGFHDDEALRVMILTGAGERAFIGGVDIKAMVGLDPASLGGGLEVAASCDLRVASEDSTFGMPEVNVGIPSVIEAALLPRLVGWGKAREIIYTGLSLSAAEALSCGLVERVVAREKLDRAVEEWVEAIVNAGARATRLQKALIRHWEMLPVDRAIEKGIQAFGQAYQTDEPRTLMKRFLERRRDKE